MFCCVVLLYTEDVHAQAHITQNILQMLHIQRQPTHRQPGWMCLNILAGDERGYITDAEHFHGDKHHETNELFDSSLSARAPAVHDASHISYSLSIFNV